MPRRPRCQCPWYSAPAVTQPFKRALGPFDATMIVIGGIIGSGIFINPYIVAQRLDSSELVIGAWVAGALIALIGALAYAELGAMSPAAGGQYVYLRDAYHPLVAFLYGWALLFMIESGAMAAVAMTFAEYAVRLVSRSAAGLGADRRRRRARRGDWRDRVPVDHQLPRRHSRQPPAERLRGVEGCRPRGADRRRLVLQRRARTRRNTLQHQARKDRWRHSARR